MGLFGKETCGACGGELGSGKRKLGGGPLCGACADKLSPFFADWDETTLSDAKAQLAYREANKADVAAFNPTRTLGTFTKVLLDDDARKLIIASSDEWRACNPDVIDFSQVIGCDVEVYESRTEVKSDLGGEKEVDCDSAHYEVSFEIFVSIDVDSPWFDVIELKTHQGRIEEKHSPAYADARQRAFEIRSVLTDLA